MRRKNIIFIGILLLLFAHCSKKTVQYTPPVIPEGRYRSEFPFPGGPSQMEAISRTILKVYYVVYYKTYEFSEASRMTLSGIAAGNFKKEALNVTLAPQTMSATGTVILDNENRVALITCAHIFELPDTLTGWYEGNLQPPNAFLRFISISERKDIFVKSISEWGAFNLLAIDHQEDIAIIGKQCVGKTRRIEVFPGSTGNSKELSWGSTVYVVSYPLGTLMITKGIVSNPRSDERGTFMIDALLNRGSSGGIVLAVRSLSPGFELVGMLKSAYTSKEYFLKPDKDVFETKYNEMAPYRGEIFVESIERINYGVAPVIPVDVIRSFYKKNRDDLFLSGYNLDNFFQP